MILVVNPPKNITVVPEVPAEIINDVYCWRDIDDGRLLFRPILFPGE